MVVDPVARAPATTGEVATVFSSVMVAGGVEDVVAALRAGSTLVEEAVVSLADAEVAVRSALMADRRLVTSAGESVAPGGSEAEAAVAPAMTVTVTVVTLTPLSEAALADAEVVVVPVVVAVVSVDASVAVAAAATAEPTWVGKATLLELEPPGAAAAAKIPPSAPVAEMRLAAFAALVQVTNCEPYACQ